MSILRVHWVRLGVKRQQKVKRLKNPPTYEKERKVPRCHPSSTPHHFLPPYDMYPLPHARRTQSQWPSHPP